MIDNLCYALSSQMSSPAKAGSVPQNNPTPMSSKAGLQTFYCQWRKAGVKENVLSYKLVITQKCPNNIQVKYSSNNWLPRQLFTILIVPGHTLQNNRFVKTSY